MTYEARKSALASYFSTSTVPPRPLGFRLGWLLASVLGRLVSSGPGVRREKVRAHRARHARVASAQGPFPC